MVGKLIKKGNNWIVQYWYLYLSPHPTHNLAELPLHPDDAKENPPIRGEVQHALVVGYCDVEFEIVDSGERKPMKYAKLISKYEIPAELCDHANEVPAVCTCSDNCYCKSHTCKKKPELSGDWDEVAKAYSGQNHLDLEQVRYTFIPFIDWLKKNYSPPTPLNPSEK